MDSVTIADDSVQIGLRFLRADNSTREEPAASASAICCSIEATQSCANAGIARRRMHAANQGVGVWRG
jgi:hypothetical protein